MQGFSEGSSNMHVYIPICCHRRNLIPHPTEIHALCCSLTSSTIIIHSSSNYLLLDRSKKQPMPAMSSLRALFFLFPLIPLSIAIAIPPFDDFLSTENFQRSVSPDFNGATTDSNNAVGGSRYIALAPTTNYAETTTPSQDEFGNFDNLLAEQPPLTNQDQGQGLPQAVESGDFVVPGNNKLPTLEQTPPNQLETPQLNTADTQPLPTPNTVICKNPKETIPVCHSMRERTLIPPPLELEMATTTSPTYPFCPGLEDILWCCGSVQPMTRGPIPEYNAKRVNHWFGIACHSMTQQDLAPKK